MCNQCLNCTLIQRVEGSPQRRCRLNDPIHIIPDFLENVNEELRPSGRYIIPNGECPFELLEQQVCPFYNVSNDASEDDKEMGASIAQEDRGKRREDFNEEARNAAINRNKYNENNPYPGGQ